MNRGGRRGRGFGRRTVLQLDDKKEHGPYASLGYTSGTTAVAPSLGLVAHYGMSDDEEESEEELQTPPNELAPSYNIPPPQEEPVPDDRDNMQNGHGRLTRPSGQQRGPNDIDSKVADFLAEISAIAPEDENSQDIDGIPLDGLPLTSEGSTERQPVMSDSEEDSADEEDELAKLQPPVAPITRWMHCLDDATQCYYYWHTETNAVQWEIPADYQQYLLRMKEFEQQLTAYQAKKELLETKAKKRRRKKEERELRKQKQRTTNGPKFGGPIEPLEVYPPPGDSPEPEVTYGPPMQPSELTQNEEEAEEAVQYGPELPTDPPVSDVAAEDNEDTEMQEPGIGSELSARDPDEYSDHESDLPKPTASAAKYKGMNFVAASKEDSEEETEGAMIGPVLPPELSQETPEKKHKHRKRRRRRHSSSSSSSSNSTSSSDSEEEQDKKTNPTQTPMEEEETQVETALPTNDDQDGDFDIEDFEDIDRQLELALERKKDMLKRMENGEDGATKEDFHKKKESTASVETAETSAIVKVEDIKAEDGHKNKRKHIEEKSPVSSPKRRKEKNRQENEESPSKVIRKKVDVSTIKLKAEVAELATLVTDKLEFLEITRKGLSKLQIILIEMETRLSDWREGGLSTSYLLSKLQEADDQLQQYEASAAPRGWACHWDRTFRRYFYFNAMTGDTQWDYPEVISKPPSPAPPKEPPPPRKQPTTGSGDAVSYVPPPPQDEPDLIANVVPDTSAPPPPPLDDTDVTGVPEVPVQPPLPADTSVIVPDSTYTHKPPEPPYIGSHNLTPPPPSHPYPSPVAAPLPVSVPAPLPPAPVPPPSYSQSSVTAYGNYPGLSAPAPPPPDEPPPPGTEPTPPLPNTRPPPPPPDTHHDPLHAPPPPPPVDHHHSNLSLPPPPPPDSPPPPPPGTSPPPVSPEVVDMDIDSGDDTSHNVPPGSAPHSLVPPPMPPLSSMGPMPTAVISRPPTLSVPHPVPAHSAPLTGLPTSYANSTMVVSAPVMIEAPPAVGYPAVAAAPPQPVSDSASHAPSTGKEKKKKKDKKPNIAGGLALKKKNFPSLVQKWQQIQEEVERESTRNKPKDDD